MAYKIFDRLWHQKLGRPYRLARTLDKGRGSPVVLLHGIGKTGSIWQHVVEQLPNTHRVVAFDMLGFGTSPKPEWSSYSTEDHVRAVIASIEKLRLGQPVIIVGHSMGCLVAVRVARLRPNLVKHLVLYEMPLYEGLPNKRIYRLRTDLYYRFYKRVMKFQPGFNVESARLAQRIAKKVIGFEVDAQTWHPFIKSLENTIMKQTAAADIKQIRVPMDVIYGTRDTLVIRGKPQKFFGEDSGHITAHTIRERHKISVKASKFIVQRIEAAATVDAKYEA